MASLHIHRKLLPANSPDEYSSEHLTVETCLYFCHSQRNNTSPKPGFCPEACLAICPSVCHYLLTDVPFPPPAIPNKSQNLSPLLLCMLILLASTFLLITLYILYTKLYYHFYAPNSNNSFLQRRSRRRRRESDAGSYSADEENRNRVVFHPFWSIPTVGLPPAEIRSIPVHKYGKEMEVHDCAVCLAEFEEGDELRVLPKCNHAFHIPCIDTWLSSHTTCPLCRSPVTSPDDDHNSDHDHPHKAEDTSSSLTSMEGAREDDNSPAEVLSITVTGGEEVENNTNENQTENSRNKDQENPRRVNEGSSSSSQRWSLERGAANLLSRSLSCSGKIFSSRSSNIRPSPNSYGNNTHTSMIFTNNKPPLWRFPQ